MENKSSHSKEDICAASLKLATKKATRKTCDFIKFSTILEVILEVSIKLEVIRKAESFTYQSMGSFTKPMKKSVELITKWIGESVT